MGCHRIVHTLHVQVCSCVCGVVNSSTAFLAVCVHVCVLACICMFVRGHMRVQVCISVYNMLNTLQECG